MESIKNERRYKIVHMQPRLIIDILNWCNAPDGSCLATPKECGLPEDCEVVGVYYSFECDAFMVKLFHQSFDEVPTGMQTPIHHLRNLKVIRKYPAVEDKD